MQYLYLALATAPFIVVLDFIWLGYVARDFYQGNLAHLLAPTPMWAAAVIFYVLYAVGLAIFAVSPGLTAKSLFVAAGLGALFGFFAYATYDLSNMATLKDWPLMVTLVDITWGAFLSGVAAGGAYLVLTSFFGF